MNHWLICFALFYQLDLVLQLTFASDNIILIFSQSNVNFMIDSKYISNKFYPYFKSNKIDKL